MDPRDAAALLADAVPPGGHWADLGAGSGTFTRALLRLLGPEGRVLAVDRDARAMAALREPRVTTRVGDFTDPALALPPLDGVLLANALHYVPHDAQRDALARLTATLRPGGRLVVVEYEHRAPNRWVPYPVDLARLAAIVPPNATPPLRVAERRSAYGGTMYAAWSALGALGALGAPASSAPAAGEGA
jgi:SAM-dependent methyltransferase